MQILKFTVLNKSKWLYLASIFLILSCVKPEDATIPAYIHVPSIEIIPGDPAIQGSDQHSLRDAWISVDGYVLGTTDMPTTLPYIIEQDTGTQQVRIFAGIHKNGIRSQRAIYPFLEPYEANFDLQGGQIDTIFPQLRYDSRTKFIIVDDFENAGIVFGDDLDDYPDSDLVKETNDVFEGTASGRLYIDSLNPVCFVGSSFRYSDIQDVSQATPVYLELHYKTEVTMKVGFIAHYNFGNDVVSEQVGMNPNEGWNKIYFDLTSDVFSLNADSYSVYINAVGTAEIPEPKVYVDNIKILHF